MPLPLSPATRHVDVYVVVADDATDVDTLRSNHYLRLLMLMMMLRAAARKSAGAASLIILLTAPRVALFQ